jgi:type IV pilus assembly protein PilV
MLNMTTNARGRKARGQGGSILLEALVAILIFSVGILAVVGMQTAAVKAASDAKYRSDASLLANELIGQMWVSDRVAANMQINYQGGSGTNGAAYTAWLANVMAALPGVTATVNQPTVAVDTATGQVTIVVNWLLPSEPAGTTAHNFSVIAQIK